MKSYLNEKLWENLCLILQIDEKLKFYVHFRMSIQQLTILLSKILVFCLRLVTYFIYLNK